MVNTLPLHDVVILGGGLAGLTLALQLKRRDPDLDVLVLERRSGPAPEAIHKVAKAIHQPVPTPRLRRLLCASYGSFLCNR